jgi:hypothetical protein
VANAVPESQGRERVATDREAVSLPILDRHPDDGWVLARPYPMRRGVLRALRGLIVHMLPPAPSPRSPEMLARVEEQARIHMVYMPRIAAFGLCIALVFLEWAPRLMFKSHRRLSKMDTASANEILERLSQSRISLVATMMLGVRATIMSSFWDQDESHRLLGYNPQPFLAERKALRLRLIEDQPEVSRIRLRSRETLKEVAGGANV